MSLSRIFYAIASLLVFFLLGLYFFHPITNLVGDLGYYLKIGEIISKTKAVPGINLFSYTYPKFPFINPNWLSELIFYWFYNYFSANALIVLSMVLMITAFSFIFILAARKFDIFTTILIALIYIQVLFERTEVKPELFSYLFLSIFMTVLYQYREKYTKWIFILIPLELFWVNFHIYFFIGSIVLLLFLIDIGISQKNTLSSRKFLTLFVVTIFSGIVTICNPNFLNGALFPFFVLNNYGFPVEENANYFLAVSSYTDTTFLYFGISILILWGSILLTIKKIKLIDILLALFFTFMGFFAIRAFPLFVFGTFISCVKANSYLMQIIVKKLNKFNKNKILYIKITFFILICILLIPTIKLNLNIHGVGFGVIDNANDAVGFLQRNNLNGPMYNNYDIGNYLEFRLYPQEKVFADGKPEAYPKEFFQNIYFPLQDSQAVFDRVSKKYNFNILFIEHTDTSADTTQFLHDLLTNNNWKMVYLNNSIVIFLKDTPGNQKIIKKYFIDQNNVHISKIDFDNKNNVRQLVNFFRTVGWEKQWLAMNLRYLDFEPTNCAALQNTAYILQKENNPALSIYLNKYQTLCL